MPFYLACLLLLTLAQCGSETEPAWYRTGQHVAYPADRYLVAIGSAPLKGARAETLALAVDSGLQQMARNIRVEIKSSQLSNFSMFNTLQGDDRDHVEASSLQNWIQSRSDLLLEGAKTIDQWQDREEGWLHVFLALDYRQALKSIRRRIDHHLKVRDRAVAKARILRSQGDVIGALQHYTLTLEKELLLEGLYAQERFFDLNSVTRPRLDGLVSEIQSTRQNLQFSILPVLKQDLQIEQAMTNVLHKRGYQVGSDWSVRQQMKLSYNLRVKKLPPLKGQSRQVQRQSLELQLSLQDQEGRQFGGQDWQVQGQGSDDDWAYQQGRDQLKRFIEEEFAIFIASMTALPSS